MDRQDSERLITRIEDERSRIETYLRRARRRYAWLTTIAIVSSALAAAFTAGPALGGGRFTGWAAQALGPDATPSDVWRPLCLLALVVSITAAICVNLNQASKADSKILNAEVCNTELACLHTLLDFGQVSLDDALRSYSQSLAKVPFIDRTRASATMPDVDGRPPAGAADRPRRVDG